MERSDGAALDFAIEHSLADVSSSEWNALTGSADPFLEHEFLRALEVSGAIGDGTGWEPWYVLARRGARLVGALAAFTKWDSYGEFVFDWNWADAYHRAGLRYYPKAVLAAPFTPVTGSRLLVEDGVLGATAHALVERLLAHVRAQRLSGAHVLFSSSEECEFLAAYGFLPRLTHQYHWLNRGYGDFGDFLADLRANKRKQITKERRNLAASGLEVEIVEGDRLSDEHRDAMWRFYTSTLERKLSEPYLNEATFARLFESFRHRLVLVMARDTRGWIGGALHVRKGGALYGRYWGCDRWVPGLHFECCYYRAIEYAIANGLAAVEAGAQGEHKFLRGFVARPIHSAHWVAHPGARAAIAQALEEERRNARDVIAAYNGMSPVKAVRSGAS